MNAIRKCEEWTQTEFAEKLDVSKQYMCDLECGRRFVRPKTAANFAQKLGYAENQFVRLCLQDMVNKDGIKLQVDVKPRVSLPRRNYSPQKQKHG